MLALLAAASAVAQGRRISLEEARQRMLAELSSAGITNQRVLNAMRVTPRHEFVLPRDRHNAYFDMSLPIGDKQTISGPFVVAYMTQELDPQPTDRVLEIGTGSGFQAAVLSPLVKDVYSIEIVEPLGRRAQRTLKRLNYENVHTKIGDGFKGWPEHAPFDKIIVTCSPEDVPQPLVDQLAEGGRMIVPVGERFQQVLYLFTKKDGKLVSEALRPTLFVPMTGIAEDQRQIQPDPLRPQLANGGFEEQVGTEGEPVGWYYCRQFEVVAENAPQGKQFMRFANDVPGRMSGALQGFAVDGQKVFKLRVQARLRGREIRPGQSIDQLPALRLVFYDDNWAIIGRTFAGPYRGSFDWTEVSETLRVPPRATKAILHIGLLGAVGELAVDDVHVSPAVP